MNIGSTKWRSLKVRVTLTTICILVIAIWSLAFYAGKAMRNDMQRQLGDQQQATVKLVTATVNSEFRVRMDAIHKVALSMDAGMVNDPAALQKLIEQRPLLQVLFNAGVFVTRSDGVAICEFPLIGRIGLNYMDRDHVALALTQGKASVGKPIIGKRVQAASFAITAPFFDKHGKVIGAISGATDLSKPNFLDDLNQSRYGLSGGYLVVDPKGKQFVIATDNNRSLAMQPTPPTGINAVFDQRMDGFDEPAINTNSMGIEVLTSSARIPLAGWFVIASLPTEEAFAPIRNMLERTAIATLLLTLVAGALAWWILKRQLSPMSQAIQTLTALSLSDSAPQLVAVTTKDEIGDLLAAFNRLLGTLRDRDGALHYSEERFRNFFEKNSSVQLLIEPVSGVIEDANLAAEIYYGYAREKLVGMPISDINTLSPERIARERLLALQESRNYFQFQHRLFSGEVRDVEVHSTPIESHGRILLLSIVHDVTERKLAQAQLQQSMREQRAILDSNIAGIVKLKDRRFIWMNQTFAVMLGYTVEELAGQPTRILYADEKAHAAFAAEAYPVLQSGTNFRKEMQFYRKDGSTGWFDLSGELLGRDSAESIWSFIDITERKTAEDRLALSESNLKGILEGAADAIFIANQTGMYQYVNRQASALLGYTHEEFMSMSIADITPAEDLEAAVNQFKDGLSHGGLRGELRLKRRDGSIVPVEINASLLADGNMYGACRDITVRKQLEEDIRQLAFHDTLTDLPNRRLLSDRLEQMLLAIKRSGRHAAVMFMDLDNFKPLNDLHGHEVGDKLLVEVAERLKACVREIDTVARIGGDEFVVMLGELDLDFMASQAQAVAIAEKVRVTLAQTYRLAVQHTGQAVIAVQHNCTASIGIVVFKGDDGSQEDILKWADSAMYEAKDAGRNVVKLYQDQSKMDAL